MIEVISSTTNYMSIKCASIINPVVMPPKSNDDASKAAIVSWVGKMVATSIQWVTAAEDCEV